MKTLTVIAMLLLLSGCMSILEKNSALLQAASSGDTLAVQRMLDKGADINAKDRYGDTALHLAIKNKNTDAAELLVSRGANVNAPGALGDTPLHVSVYKNQQGVTEILRRQGAEETVLNQYGLRPAEMQGLPELETKIGATAQLLTAGGSWTDMATARVLYDELKSQQDKYLINSLVLQVIQGDSRRLQVLILAIKLGIPESEDKLVRVLMVYGNKSMAEDYLNSGSSSLAAGGRRWARANRYRIMTGPGSHRASWGRF